MSEQTLSVEMLGDYVLNIIERAQRGELSRAYAARGATDSPTDNQLAAAAIVGMCREAFLSGEWETA